MAKPLLRSFAGGVITPELFGRLDTTKFQTGLQIARNMVTLPHGPATRRGGFRYVNEALDSSENVHVIPFAFSADQTMVLEFGHEYIRFHTGGATLLEASKAVVSIVGSTVTVTGHGYTAGRWVYMGGRYFIIATTPTADTYTVTALAGAAVTPTGTTAAQVYQITTDYQGADLFELHYAQDSDVLTLVHPSYPARELRRLGATNWTLTDVSFAPTLSAPAGPSAVATVAVATNLTTQTYVITAVDSDGVTESVASATASCSNNLTLAGNYNTVSWSAVGGALRYHVYKLRGGVFGYIGRTAGTSLVDDNVTADTLKTPPESLYALNTGADDYPGAVTYHEQRRWFAGTNDRPQHLFATRSGTDANLTSSLPSQSDDAIVQRLRAQQQNRIRHLAPLSDLLALTVGGEWRIFADGEPAITPESISIKPQGYSGAANVQPALTSGSALYVQAQGSRVRELAYGGETANYSYRSIDLSIMAPHLFDGYTIKAMAYSRAPDQTLWAVRSDGTLLGMTYVPDQAVAGWHYHDTESGTFESCCCVSEGSEDVLYVVVRRTIAGRTIRTIERMASRIYADVDDAFYVDCGLTYDSTPATVISGLWHLEGETVDAFADGATVLGLTVTGGAVTLPAAASTVHIGLPMESDMMTLPIVYEAAAYGQSLSKNVRSVALRVRGSALVKAGRSFTDLRQYPARAVSDPYGSPPSLTSGWVEITVPGQWDDEGAVCVRQDEPAPLTVVAMVLDVAGGG